MMHSDYYYELVIYRNDNNADMHLSVSSSNNYVLTFQSIKTSNTIIYEDLVTMEKYQTVYPIALNSIYTLTREAAYRNSLYLDFTVNTGGDHRQYLEF